MAAFRRGFDSPEARLFLGDIVQDLLEAQGKASEVPPLATSWPR